MGVVVGGWGVGGWVGVGVGGGVGWDGFGWVGVSSESETLLRGYFTDYTRILLKSCKLVKLLTLLHPKYLIRFLAWKHEYTYKLLYIVCIKKYF